jgi:amino acid transporter
MTNILSYIFWPNPGNADYDSPKVIALMILCVLLMLATFGISYWRRSVANQSMRRISKSWASASFWFGLVGLILIVARVEQIQYIAMRFMWALWLLVLVAYLYLQVRNYRLRYYEVLPNEPTVDPRSKYLPKKKRR